MYTRRALFFVSAATWVAAGSLRADQNFVIVAGPMPPSHNGEDYTVLTQSAANNFFGTNAPPTSGFQMSDSFLGDTDPNDLHCAFTNARWNVPNGGMVSSRARTTSPVRAGIAAMGGMRTHSMLAHGPEWTTMASIDVKIKSGFAKCQFTGPIKEPELSYGHPGASTVNTAALFSYLYVNDGIDYLAYQNGTPPKLTVATYDTSGYQFPANTYSGAASSNPGKAITDYVWFQMPYETIRQTVRVPGPDAQGDFFVLLNALGNRHYYRLGELVQYDRGTYSDGTGVFCSGFLYDLQYAAGVRPAWGTSGGGTPVGPVAPITPVPLGGPARQAAHDKSAAALQAFYNQAELACNQRTVGGWGRIAAAGGCTTAVSTLCARAARQLTSCITDWTPNCSATDAWMTKRDDPNWVAQTYSPDRLAGLEPNLRDKVTSVWSYDGSPKSIVWNTSGGRQYGCWAN
jgi:hypothetical protein